MIRSSDAPATGAGRPFFYQPPIPEAPYGNQHIRRTLRECQTSSILGGDVTIFINNISPETSKETIWGWLKRATGRSSHTIYFSDRGSAVAAFNSLSALDLEQAQKYATKHPVDGKILRVSIAKKTAKILVNHLPVDARAEQILRHFCGCGLANDTALATGYKYDQDTTKWTQAECASGSLETVLLALPSEKEVATALASETLLGSHQLKTVPYFAELGLINAKNIYSFSDTTCEQRSTPVIIRGWPNTLDIGIVRQYLSDRNQSGGGELESLSIEDKNIVAIFKNAEDAKRVHLKSEYEGHTVQGVELMISMDIIHEDPLADKDRVLLSQIGQATEDSVKYLIEGVCNAEVKKMQLVKSQNESLPRFLAHFTKPINYRQLCQGLSSISLDGVTLQPSQFRADDSAVLVSGLPPEIMQDDLESIFPEARRCNKLPTGEWMVVFRESLSDEGNLVERCQSYVNQPINLKIRSVKEFEDAAERRLAGQRASPTIALDHVNPDVLRYILQCKNLEIRSLENKGHALLKGGLNNNVLKEMPYFVLSLKRTDPRYARAVSNWTGFKAEVESFFCRYSMRVVTCITRPTKQSIFDYINQSKTFKETKQSNKGDLGDFKILTSDMDPSLASHEFKIIGEAHIVEQVAIQIAELQENTIKTLEKCQVQFGRPEWFIQLIEESGESQRMGAEYSGLTVIVDRKNRQIVLHGLPLQVDSCMKKIYGLWKDHAEKSSDETELACQLLQKSQAKESVKKVLQKEGLQNKVKWFIKATRLVVKAFDAETANKASRKIKASFTQTTIPTELPIDDEVNGFSSAVEELRQRHTNHAVIDKFNDEEDESSDVVDKLILLVACLKEFRSSLYADVQKLLGPFVTKSSFLPLPVSLATYTEHFMTADINERLETKKLEAVSIEALKDEDESGIQIFGSAGAISASTQVVLEMLSGKDPVEIQNIGLEVPGAVQYLIHNSQLLETIGDDTRTVIGFQNSDYFMQVNEYKQLIIASATLPHNVQLDIAFGQLAQCQCDTIVNAVDERSTCHGSNDSPNEGTPEDAASCTLTQANLNRLHQDKILITNANAQQRKTVLHVLNPQWDDGSRNEEQTLRERISLVLKYAELHGLKHLCLPPLGNSEGFHSFPPDIIAKVFCEIFCSYFSYCNRTLKRITVTTTHGEILRSLKNRLLKSSGFIRLADKDLTFSASATRNGFKVEYINCPWANVQTDVVLNALQFKAEDNFGASSNDVLKAAGPEPINELKQRGELQHRKTYATTNGALKCKQIINFFIDHWNGGCGNKVLQDALTEGLNEACRQGAKFIAIPAIGIETHGFPTEESAIAVAKTITKFYKKSSEYALNIKVIGPRSNFFAHVFGDSLLRQLKDLECQGLSEDFLSERPEERIAIGQFVVELSEGDITEEQCGAIVCSYVGSIDWCGQVAREIRSKAGESVVLECTRGEANNHDGIFVSGAGNLNCGKIIHVDMAEGVYSATKKCVEKAKYLAIHSMSVPAVGTGGLHMDPATAAYDMMRAVCDLGRTNAGKYDFKVRIILRDKTMFDIYRQAMRRSSADIEHWLSTYDEDSDDTMTFESSLVPSKVEICGTLGDIKKAEAKLRSHLDAEISRLEICINDNSTERLSTEQIRELIEFAESHCIGMKVEKTEGVKILLWSVDPELQTSYVQLQSLVKEMKTQNQNYLEMSMLFKWQLQLSDGSWHSYSHRTSTNIEKCKRSYKTSYLHMLNGKCYIIDLVGMSCYPKSNSTQALPVRRLSFEIDIPASWNPSQLYNEIPVSQGSDDWVKITKELTATLKPHLLEIIKITRIQNYALYQQYLIQRKRIHDGMTSKTFPVERWIWHLTDETVVQRICRSGFDRKIKQTGFEYEGVHFARDADYLIQKDIEAVNSKGERYLIYSQVATGEYQNRNSTEGDYRDFVKYKQSSAYVPYDSVVDDMNDPKTFSIYNDAQAYPMFVINLRYKSS